MQAVAGQKIHEAQYGAELRIGNVTIPCACAKIEKDFDLIPGGQSRGDFIPSLTFRAELVRDMQPDKGHLVEVRLTPGSDWFAGRLWSGGLVTDGRVYQFMVVAANYGN